jgi:hypothetical protein
MSITQFLALAFISFATACSLALLESEALQGHAWDLAAETQNLAGVPWLKFEATDESGADSKTPVTADPPRALSDSKTESAIANQLQVLTTQPAQDDPTAMALQREIDDLRELLTPLVVQERLLTRELGEEDIEVELTREEIAILKAELGEAEARLEAWHLSEQLKQVAHIRDAASHLRDAGLLELADALDRQLQAYASDNLPTVVLPTTPKASDAEKDATSEIDVLREEISRLRNDVKELKQR